MGAGGACDHARSVLLGEAPGDATTHLLTCGECRCLKGDLDGFDAMVAALPPLPVPPDLAEQTLQRVMDEALPRGSRLVWALYPFTALALAALGLMMVLPPAPPTPGELVQRGSGDRLPELALKIAVLDGDRVTRLRRGEQVRSGSRLSFRAFVDRTSRLTLLRTDAAGTTLVHAQDTDAGEVDLSAGRGLLLWELEPSDSGAVFSLVAGDLDLAELTMALDGADDRGDPASICRAALGRGVRCVGERVEVQP